MATAALQRGQRISEYVLEERLGGGGFGEVWRARHHVLPDRCVAVKVPTHPTFARQLRNEGLLQHALANEHIVRTIGLDPYAEPPYVIMDLVEGESLRDLLRREKRLAPRRALDLSVQVLKALEYAHLKGVVHRDVKPENILIDRHGVVKLTDFGLGAVVARTTVALDLSGELRSEASGSPQLAGTLKYMSPEQRDPARTVDHLSDLYSFGVVFFEMLSGEVPEGNEVPSERVRGLDRRLDEIFRLCYTRRERRARSAAQLIREIDEVRKGTARPAIAAVAHPATPPGEVPAAAMTPTPVLPVPAVRRRAPPPAGIYIYGLGGLLGSGLVAAVMATKIAQQLATGRAEAYAAAICSLCLALKAADAVACGGLLAGRRWAERAASWTAAISIALYVFDFVLGDIAGLAPPTTREAAVLGAVATAVMVLWNVQMLRYLGSPEVRERAGP